MVQRDRAVVAIVVIVERKVPVMPDQHIETVARWDNNRDSNVSTHLWVPAAITLATIRQDHFGLRCRLF